MDASLYVVEPPLINAGVYVVTPVYAALGPSVEYPSTSVWGPPEEMRVSAEKVIPVRPKEDMHHVIPYPMLVNPIRYSRGLGRGG